MIVCHRVPLKKGSGYTLQIERSKGESRTKKYLSSIYNPQEEAEKWAQEAFEPEARAYAVYGIGALYHIEALCRKISQQKKTIKLILIEPFEEVRKVMEEEPRLQNLLKEDFVRRISSLEEVDLRGQIGSFLTAEEIKTMKALVYPSYQGLDLSLERLFLQVVKNLKVQTILTRNTLYYFKDCFPENLIRNAKYLLHAPRIETIENLFPGRTAVVVSAGPSLEKNIEVLKEYRDQVLIISGGRSLKALLKRGIEPHFVCSVDSHEINHRLYQSMEILDCGFPLVCSWGNHYGIVRDYQGEKIFFNDSGLSDLDRRLFGERVGSLTVGLTVASLQVSLAELLGCGTILFIGQDMAYAEGRQYGEDTASSIDKKTEEGGFFEVRGNVQDKVRTNYELDSFRVYLEGQIRGMKGCKFINATEGGAYMKGTEVRSLKEALDAHAGEKEEFHGLIEKALIKRKDERKKEGFAQNLRDMLEDAKKLESYGKEGLKLSMRVSLDFHKNKPILKKLEAIDEKIGSVKESTELSNYFIQEELHLLGEKTAEELKDKEIIAQTRLLYRSIMQAGEKMRVLLESELKNLEGFGY
ncbi:MAG: DUF115 domain-containing protein [Peptostreptococcaceae bacterium]|nr:DUF115 domain-containing protein [Peptostreptococcaceae bacterium]